MEAPGARPGAEVFLASLVLRVDRRGRRPRVVLDRQLGAEDVAMGRKIVVGARDRSAAQVEAECALTLDIPMLVLGTEDNVDQIPCGSYSRCQRRRTNHCSEIDRPRMPQCRCCRRP